MPKADFTISLSFRGMNMGEGQEDYFLSSIRSLANDYAHGAMCSEWRDAWQREETAVTMDAVHEDHYELYTVRLTIPVSAVVRVNAVDDSGFDRANEWAHNLDVADGTLGVTVRHGPVVFDLGDISVDDVSYGGDVDGTSDVYEVSP